MVLQAKRRCADDSTKGGKSTVIPVITKGTSILYNHTGGDCNQNMKHERVDILGKIQDPSKFQILGPTFGSFYLVKCVPTLFFMILAQETIFFSSGLKQLADFGGRLPPRRRLVWPPTRKTAFPRRVSDLPWLSVGGFGNSIHSKTDKNAR